MPAIGKLFILLGVVLVVLGLGITFADRIPYIGRLPGDIYIKREKFSFYFPIATSLIISIILTILFSIFRK